MSFQGIIIGIAIFIIIGVLHPVVVKAEYYLSEKCWPLFALAGTACCVVSIFTANKTLSILLAVLGFSLYWSIGELMHQAHRVAKGWYPKNPKRRIPYADSSYTNE